MITSALKRRQSVLEDKLTSTTKKLKDVTNQLQDMEKSCKRISEALLDRSTTKVKRKAWSECSVQYQKKRKRQI